MGKRVLLLINTGTPEKPEVRHVRRYLYEFLNDRRIIDLPWIFRKLLVNIIIVPLRAPKSARLYRKLWTEKGSPLLINLQKLVLKLTDKLDNKYMVSGAMRYGFPSLRSALEIIKKESVNDITIFPLYPQYASSTTGSAIEVVLNEIRRWNIVPSIKVIEQYYSHPSFIDAYARLIKLHDPGSFDHILFSYHGLPVRHIQRIHPEILYNNCDCHNQMPEHGTYCYKAACHETTRLLADKLHLREGSFSTSFQSRFSKDWLKPFTDQIIKELAANGRKKILIAAPSFTADCLETLIEIREEYNDIFRSAGGEAIVLVESLNDNDEWAEAIIRIADLKS